MPCVLTLLMYSYLASTTPDTARQSATIFFPSSSLALSTLAVSVCPPPHPASRTSADNAATARNCVISSSRLPDQRDRCASRTNSHRCTHLGRLCTVAQRDCHSGRALGPCSRSFLQSCGCL